MEASSVVTTILSDESVSSISKRTGASKKDISSVLSAALPLLLAGANSQAQDQNTAQGFTNALVQHSAADTSNVSSFLSGVDLSDGAKIIAHLLGVKPQSQTQAIAQQSGVSAADTGSILAAAAPLLMSLLGQQTQVQTSSSPVAGLMGALLGSLVSGSQQQSSSSGIDLGGIAGILGSLLK